MRLKKILLEEAGKDQFLKDCSHFIDQNKKRLKNENFLVRGTPSVYDSRIVRKNYRERREVKGSRMRTYLYEKFKPSGVPSREVTVPCQSGNIADLDEQWKRGKQVYYVFPVGDDYELVYTDGVIDFNSGNPYLDNVFDPRSFLTRVKRYIEKGDAYWHEVEAYIRDMRERDYDNIRRSYEEAVEFIENTKGMFDMYKSIHYDEVMSKLEKNREKIREFFNNTHVSKQIPEKRGLEVSVFIPVGFYYIRPDVLKEIFKEYLS